MDAERVKEIIKSEIMTADKSSLDGCCLFDERVLLMAIRDAAYEITTELEDETAKSNPPEPPKTVLPDMSDLKPYTDAWFFAEDGTRVSCFCCYDGECQWSADREEGFSPSYFVSLHPHLGRLREAIPGGWA